jgi:hypothetical protein
MAELERLVSEVLVTRRDAQPVPGTGAQVSQRGTNGTLVGDFDELPPVPDPSGTPPPGMKVRRADAVSD